MTDLDFFFYQCGGRGIAQTEGASDFHVCSRFVGYHFAVAPEVDGGAVGAGGFAGGPGDAAQGAAGGREPVFWLFYGFG